MSTWTLAMDQKIRDLRAKSPPAPFSVIAANIGVSKCAVISRWHRLIGTKFPSSPQPLTAEQHSERRRKLIEKEGEVLRVVDHLLRSGASKSQAMAAAKRRGLTFVAIGIHFRMTKQAVQQAIARAGLSA